MGDLKQQGRAPGDGRDGAGDDLDLSPEAIARLETLDDLIFPAIDGDLAAAEASAPVWRETVAELGPEAVAESRSEYLRYARCTWQFLNRQTVQQPLRMLAVLKVIGMLMGDES
jgi:hypothetical protein